MPRANRYILPGHTYHLTHRCHDRTFLLRFAVHRTEYLRRLRTAVERFGISLLSYCITSNHVHLLATSNHPGDISQFMQKLEGEFAQYYNLRKRRRGAFWQDRYHCTMIESGDHLRNCMRYIDLNMVRAGVVKHPREWRWCSYHELVGIQCRYCMLDLNRVLESQRKADLEGFRRDYTDLIDRAIEEPSLKRESQWTESIAVGSKGFVKAVVARTEGRRRLLITHGDDDSWAVRECDPVYEIKARKSDLQVQA